MKDLHRELEILLQYEFTDGQEKEKPIVIVGPDGTTKTMLRVYAYGGCLGRVATRESDNNQLANGTAYAELLKDADANKDYDYLQSMALKYPELEKNPGTDLREKLSGRLKEILSQDSGEEKGSFLCDTEYLDLILKAAKIKFIKDVGDPKERNRQVSIVKNHMNKKQEDGWCIIDMEYRITEKYIEDWNGAQPDIIVLDNDKGFGMVELKYKNDSYENLLQHYQKSRKAADSPKAKELTEELKRRCGYLTEYKLINDELYHMSAKDGRLWYGFLFVGGKKEESVRLVEGMAKDCPEIVEDENCQFWWFPDGEIENIDLHFDPAHTYKGFISTEAH